MTSRAGFTLVEVVVAMAIACLLTVAAMRTITSVTRSCRLDQHRSEEATLAAGLRSLLSSDLGSAKGSRMPAGGGLDLHCRAGLEPKTLERRHLPNVVTYKTVKIGEVSYLLRTQQSLTGAAKFTELVCSGVTGIGPPVTADPADAENPGAWGPAPDSLLLRVPRRGMGDATTDLTVARGD
ncbi:MAG: prepilin-type N-terminal cleavage/methylation domain-containing protein [Planctomycetota bacterium]|nr:prepilin-type N-terminal cleavage/methylation domain-containing protein [Planctomycetota bacterium]